MFLPVDRWVIDQTQIPKSLIVGPGVGKNGSRSTWSNESP